MADINTAILLGRVGKDPETVTTNGGKTVTKFTMATGERWKGADGQWQEQTTWHNVVIWGPAAVWLGNNLAKGDQVLAQGKITTRSYEDKSGQKKYVTEVVANSVNILTPKEKKGSVDQGPGFSADEEIPF
jgi:single-strand DNA-binding protein